MAAKVAIDVMKQLIRYDPTTGEMYWIERAEHWFCGSDALRICASWNARYAGTRALAGVTRHGYLSGRIFNRAYLAHHVAFALTHGRWPSPQIDHRDGNPSNNRASNLRESTQAENARNCAGRRGKSSSYKGVHLFRRTSKWTAQIAVSGKSKHLGFFDTEIEAAVAYNHAAQSLHGDFARLSVVPSDG